MIASFAYLSLLWLLHAVCQVAAYKQLSNNSLASIPSPGKDFDIRTGPILAPILTVRVSGTNGNDKVRHHFVNYFRKNLPKWELSWENSTQPTALQKNIKFANLIFRRDPPWAKKGDVGRLVLAAHYDSKMEPKGFIGAVDSAAPCAMMIHAARSIDQALTRKWEAMQKNGQAGLGAEKGVELYLLDGEEAFKMWSDSDSIYGARSLASTLEKSINPAMSTYRTALNQISLFVLLDLLGSAKPTVPSYFPTTHWAYQNMADVEKRMRSLRLLKSSPKAAANSRPVRESMFLLDANKDTGPSTFWLGGGIEDDHLPFMARGVPILHMIPDPFPAVWHTPQDDGPHLDMPTTEDWAKIVTGFTAEWMELEGFMPTSNLQARSESSGIEGFLEEDDWEAHDELVRERDEL